MSKKEHKPEKAYGIFGQYGVLFYTIASLKKECIKKFMSDYPDTTWEAMQKKPFVECKEILISEVKD